MRSIRRPFELFLLGFAACALAWAQSTAQMHGTVQDTSGLAVSGAEVKATQTGTGLVRAATSGTDGSWVLTNLPLGPYRLEVAKEGFTTFVQTGIELLVQSDPLVEVALKIGQITEQVNVQANAALVETRRSGVGAVVETQRIIDLPLNGRQVTDLITLNGAAVQTGSSDQRIFSGRPYISIAGMVTLPLGGGPTDWILDGTSHNDFMSGTTLPLAFPDAVQEFKVETSGLAAVRGNASSVEVVTRSGANELHGDLFEFIRNDAFGSAREYLATKESTYKRHNYGGTIGGAIRKNRLFYFGGFQGTTQRASPNNTTIFFPTPDMVSGDFRKFESAACGRPAPLPPPFGANGFAPNTVDSRLFAAPSLYITDRFAKSMGALGLSPDPCGKVVYNVPTYQNNYQYTFKIDYQISVKHSLFFRDLWSKEYQPTLTDVEPNLLLSSQTGFNTPAYAYSVGETWIAGPTLVNSFRIGFTRINETRLKDDFFNFCTAGVQNFWCGENKAQFGQLLIVNGFTEGINYSDPPPDGGGSWYRSANYLLNDDLNWVKGAHQLAFGGAVTHGRFTSRNNFASNGQFNFTGLNNFLLGNASQMQDGLPNTQSMHETFVNLYLTDTWKLSSRLTMNAGVRWEPYFPITVPTGVIYNFDLTRFLTNVRSTQFLKAPPGFYYPGDPGFPGKSGEYTKWAEFAPRLGFAWDPKGDGKTSIRASFGFGYAFVPGLTREDQQGQNPWGGRQVLTGNVDFRNPFGSAANNPYPYFVNPNVTFTPRGLFATTPFDTPTPSYSTWNLAIQRQIGSSWLVSATYLGSKVSHLLISVPLNYAPLTPGLPVVATTDPRCTATSTAVNCVSNADSRRRLAVLNPAGAGNFFGPTMEWNAGGNQHYNAAVFSVQRRLSQGLSLSANWTWSHCIGQELGYNTKPEQTVTDPIHYNQVGNCDSDRRNVVNLTAVWLVPRFSNVLWNRLASGWKWAGIYTFRSGTPLMIQDGVDAALSTINHQQPDVIDPAHVYTGQSCGNCFYLNKSAFAAQAAGVYTGNLGWNSLVSPSYWDLDLSLSREFRFKERYRLELRADAFNLTNSFVAAMAGSPGGTSPVTQFSTSYGNPLTGPTFSLINSAQFGQILGAQPTRKIQFALKFSF